MKLIYNHGVNFGIYWAVLGEGTKVGWIILFGFIVGDGMFFHDEEKCLIVSPILKEKV